MQNQVNATNPWLTRGIKATGGLPTRVDNALNIRPTRIDLEGLFLEKQFRDEIVDGMNPKNCGS